MVLLKNIEQNETDTTRCVLNDNKTILIKQLSNANYYYRSLNGGPHFRSKDRNLRKQRQGIILTNDSKMLLLRHHKVGCGDYTQRKREKV